MLPYYTTTINNKSSFGNEIARPPIHFITQTSAPSHFLYKRETNKSKTTKQLIDNKTNNRFDKPNIYNKKMTNKKKQQSQI